MRGFATGVGAKADIGAQVLFLTDGAVSRCLDDFEFCAVLFDGNDAAALTAAREQWRGLKDGDHEPDLLAAGRPRAVGEEGLSRGIRPRSWIR